MHAEVAEICLTVEGARDERTGGAGHDVRLTLHTQSPMWTDLLGLGQGEPKPTHDPIQNRSQTDRESDLRYMVEASPDGFHHAILALAFGSCAMTHDSLLLKLWHAFSSRPADSSDGDASAMRGWTSREVLVLLFGCLGYAEKQDVCATFEDKDTPEASELAEPLEGAICLWEERSTRWVRHADLLIFCTKHTSSLMHLICSACLWTSSMPLQQS